MAVARLPILWWTRKGLEYESKEPVAGLGAGALVITGVAAAAPSGGVGQSDNPGDGGEHPVAAGTIDHGKEQLPQAGITLDQAIEAATANTSGEVGEIDLEYSNGSLVFNVDVGSQDVKVDARTGTMLGVTSDD